jgi:hypothetical protein
MNRLFLIAVILSVAACATKKTYIGGTRVPFTSNNKSVLDAVEQYRLAVEKGDSEALITMAHPQYWEDSGTPSGSDDYGFEGLKTVLASRLKQATEIRYTMRYMGVSHECKDELAAGCKATVDVLIDASFTIQNAMGKASRPDKRDQNQLLLEWNGSRWMFLAGM